MRILFLLAISNFFIASELELDQNFKAGDTISAETFNKIFNTLEKVNRPIKDSDLIGTWNCSGQGSPLSDKWVSDGKPSWYESSTISNITLTFESSGASSSYENPYSYTQSDYILQKEGYPVPGEEFPRESNKDGIYVLKDNKLIILVSYSGTSYTSTKTYEASLLSPSRVRFHGFGRTITCDKQ